MEDLVSVYSELRDFDSREDGLSLYVYKDKNHLMRDYVRDRLLYMKIDEPNYNEKYENTFKKYLEELRLLTNPFKDDELIILGIFSNDNNVIDINNSDVRLYHKDELDLLIEDIDILYG